MLGALALLAPIAVAKPARDPRLRAALVQLKDLPDGWASITDNSPNDDSLMCGIDPTGATTGQAFEETGFSSAGGFFGAYVFSSVARYRSGEAKKALRAAAKAIGCSETVTTDGRTEVTKVTALKVGRIADEAVGVRITQTGGDVSPVVFDLVLVRKGDLVGTVGTFALGAQAPPLIPLAKKVGDRLGKVR